MRVSGNSAVAVTGLGDRGARGRAGLVVADELVGEGADQTTGDGADDVDAISWSHLGAWPMSCSRMTGPI